MGLLLSVLVACVGVVELLTFYTNITRNLAAPATTDLSEVSNRYIQGLENHKKFLQEQISIRRAEEDSCEDIEVEFSLVPEIKRKSRSPTPRRILLTEKPSSRSTSPRLFLATDANETSNHLPQFRVEEKRFFSIQNENPNERIFPLPKQFTVTELDEEIEFNRSPSPYPLLEVPRNSICKELLQHDSVAEVDEDLIPETINSLEIWRNKNDKELLEHTLCSSVAEAGISHKLESNLHLNTNEDELLTYTLNSETRISNNFVKVQESSSRNEEDEMSEKLVAVLESKHDSLEFWRTKNDDDEQFLDSLDGIKKKKLSRSSSLRRSRRRRTPKDDCLSSSSMQNNDPQTAKTLTEAANVLKNVNQESGGSTALGKDSSKTPDPFWVNR